MNISNKLIMLASMCLLVFNAHAEPAPAFEPFRNPDTCIQIPSKLGLHPSEGMSSGWTECYGVWGNYTSVTTYRGRYMRVGDVDNEIVCDGRL